MKKPTARGSKSQKSKSPRPRRGASKSAARSSAKGQGSDSDHPLVRKVLFRPDRYNYVRKLIPDHGCVFCRAAKNEPSFETLCVYQSEHSMIVMNKYPYNSGHLLILPKSHKGSLLDLDEYEYEDLHRTVRKAMAALQSLYKPLAMNMGLNQGKAAGAGIPDHLHYHLIPRWDGDLNFFPLIAQTKVVIEELNHTYEKLSEHFRGLA